MIKRIFIEKKPKYATSYIKAKHILEYLGINVDDFRQFIRIDIDNISENVFDIAKYSVFCDPLTEVVYDKFPVPRGYLTLVIESKNDAYNNRLSDVYASLKLITDLEPKIKIATVYAASGITPEDFKKFRDYQLTNGFTQEGTMDMPTSLDDEEEEVDEIYNIEGFINFNKEQLKEFIKDNDLSLDEKDIEDIQKYFKEEERDPTHLEIKVLDTYLSDRVRHRTFNTKISKIDIKSENPHIASAYKLYQSLRDKDSKDAMTLMDIATISKNNQIKKGKLKEVEQSSETHSATVLVDTVVADKKEKWWVSFKNETDNTQTELEPFSGASTCMGAVLKDPISERTNVYQGIRISGSSDPRERESSIPGKISPYSISRISAKGASSQANHFGVPISMVHEMYHKKYRAKHLECALVVGANKQDNIIREKEVKDDVIVIVGARTKSETKIRKGDPLILKKIQRLFIKPEASTLIKKAYDIGVGGIACALTEMIDLGVDINLEYIPTTTENIKGEEIAISETQDRMLVLLKKDDVAKFIALANDENLEAVAIATITSTRRVRMYYDNKCLFDIKKSFFKENAQVDGKATAKVTDGNAYDFIDKPQKETMDLFEGCKFKDALLHELNRLQVCSQKGLNESFDCSLGGGSVLAQNGGRYRLTPTIASVNKLPTNGYTDTATAVTYGCIPNLLERSPFLGTIYSIVLSLSKQVACGVDIDNVYLSLQEYFEKLKDDPEKWGSAVSAMLGALYAQEKLGVYAIGGKDSMSGSYEDMGVPPTVISFALGITKASKTISNVFDYYEEPSLNDIYQIALKRDEFGVPDFKYLKKLYKAVNRAIITGGIKACNVVEEGGVLSAVFKSCMGNRLGTTWDEIHEDSYSPQLGDFVIQGDNLSELAEFDLKHIARINKTHTAELCGEEFKVSDAVDAYQDALESVYPTKSKDSGNAGNIICCAKQPAVAPKGIAKPRVVIPVVDGTLTDKEMVRRFELAGAIVDRIKIKNLSYDDVMESIDECEQLIKNAQIIAIPDGVRSLALQISIIFRNSKISDAILDLINNRDGLILGIGSGFKALLNLGLLPYGKIYQERRQDTLTLAENVIPKHISSIARVRVATNKTPWLYSNKLNEAFLVPISHKEARLTGNDDAIESLIKEGLVATQFVDVLGNATMTPPFNPNGSAFAIEGIISENGRIYGKTGNSELISNDLFKNIEGNKDMQIFENGVKYFE